MSGRRSLQYLETTARRIGSVHQHQSNNLVNRVFVASASAVALEQFHWQLFSIQYLRTQIKVSYDFPAQVKKAQGELQS